MGAPERKDVVHLDDPRAPAQADWDQMSLAERAEVLEEIEKLRRGS